MLRQNILPIQLNGVFPDTYADILSLKGVGDYTAAAIASFAYQLPHAVLDGNVYRVLSRFFAIETPTDLPAAKKQFAALAGALLDPEQPAAFNQAMMDFGALCCTPAQPNCSACPLCPECRAAQQQRVSEFPVRMKKPEKKKRFFLYLIICQGNNTWLRKRSGKDIWRGLYEFPMLEVEQASELQALTLQERFFSAGLPPGATWGTPSKHFQQILTHQQIAAVFLELHLPAETNQDFFQNLLLDGSFKVAHFDVKKKFAFPRLIVCFFNENG
jgi:A/G-specific adenine glycosylase